MTKRRLFIAINLPNKLRKRLVEYQRKWDDVDPGLIRRVKKSNLHITLVFIGYVDDDEMYEICKITEQVAKKHSDSVPDRRRTFRALSPRTGHPDRAAHAVVGVGPRWIFLYFFVRDFGRCDPYKKTRAGAVPECDISGHSNTDCFDIRYLLQHVLRCNL